MSTYYSPGCHDEKAHICDCCEKGNGISTLYWKEKDFDLCYPCLVKLFQQYIDPGLKLTEILAIRRKSISEELRDKIFKRDGYKCVKCDSPIDLVIDHKVPFARGGTTDENNLQTLCRLCNLKKGIFIDS